MDPVITANPLLYPVVIREILQNLNPSELYKVRLVSQLWNAEAVRQLKTHQIVVIRDGSGFQNFTQSSGASSGDFEICADDFTCKMDCRVREFWLTKGHTVQKLHMRQSQLYWGDLNDIMPYTPSLVELRLGSLPQVLGRVQEDAENGATQIDSIQRIRLESLPLPNATAARLLKALLFALPNLQEILFLSIPNADMERVVSNALMRSVDTPMLNLPHLNNIGTRIYLGNDEIDLLNRKQFPLISLSAHLADGIQLGPLNDLLHSLQPTVKTLTVSFDSMSQSIMLSPVFAQLDKLEHLKLDNYGGDLRTLITLPRLKSVEVAFSATCTFDPVNYQRCLGFQEHNLQQLCISSQNHLPVDLVRFLAESFRNLQFLQIPGVTDPEISTIYIHLPHLRTLKLHSTLLTDQGITGISKQVCTGLMSTESVMPVVGATYRKDLYIGCLQYLRELVVEGGTALSDASIYLGITECYGLTTLRMSNPNISDRALMHIADSFTKQLDILDVTGSDRISEVGLNYAKSKMSAEVIDVRSATPNGGARNKNRVFAASQNGEGEDPFGKTIHDTAMTFANLNLAFSMAHKERLIHEPPNEDDGLFPERNTISRIHRIARAYQENGLFMVRVKRKIADALDARDNHTHVELDDIIPEIYAAELFRLGLSTNDIRFWMRGGFRELEYI